MTEEQKPREITYLEAIREAMSQEMRRDEKVFVLGEDMAKLVPVGEKMEVSLTAQR